MKKEILENIIKQNRNIVVSGDISSGKTKSFMFPLVEEQIDNNENIIILDTKEEYISKYYETLKNKDYNIITLNLKDLNKSVGWNPLKYPYTLYKSGNVDAALDSINKLAVPIFHDKASKDPFWENSACDFFTGLVLSLFDDAKEDEVNFNSVNALFDSLNVRYGDKDLLTHYFEYKGRNSKAYTAASTTLLAPMETRGSIVSVARQKFKLYVIREKLNNLLSKTTFNYEDIVTKPTAIFIISKDENTYLSTLVEIFITQLFDILVSNSKTKYNIILDNFDILNEIVGFNSMLSSGVAQKIKFYIATRSIDKLYDTYGYYIKSLICYYDINNIRRDSTLEDENLKYVESNVEYPVLEINDIKVFDLENFLNDKNVTLPQKNDVNHVNSDKISDLINKIDNKIQELDSKDKMVNKYLDEIKGEVDQEMIKRGLMYIDDNGSKVSKFGSATTRWEIEKRILKERYNINWQSPADKNPGMKFD
ncbi:MAG: type IV secretory system conjugative DNA transfer family protein [Tenericutes bacterium]|nr:type IV secretory system conjugative DNA transfer family protein [Mycoplasmatota bacterium]